MAKKRDQVDWGVIRKTQLGDEDLARQTGKSAEEKDSVPEKACTRCKNFVESGASEKGEGYCSALRAGSNILIDPPRFVSEGEVAYFTFFNRDASKCKYYDQMEFIDHDISECADPRYTRGQRVTMK